MDITHGTIKRIHVNQHAIRAREPYPLRVKTSNDNVVANEVDILDADGTVVCTIIYRPEHPLSCGARAWIETTHAIRTRRTT